MADTPENTAEPVGGMCGARRARVGATCSPLRKNGVWFSGGGCRESVGSIQIFGSRSKYSSSSFLPPWPLPISFSDSMNSMRSIHLTIL